MRSTITLLLVISGIASAATWEPFVAKLRRVTRVEHPAGDRVSESEELYMRSADGSLRHEVWRTKNGERSSTPSAVDLTDGATSRWYRLFESELRAEWMTSAANDVTRYYQEPEGFRSGREIHQGIPCATTRIFMDGVQSGQGCRALGYGIPIRSSARFKTPDGKGTVTMETVLVEFLRNTEPPADKMRVPPLYRVVENGDAPNCPNCASGR